MSNNAAIVAQPEVAGDTPESGCNLPVPPSRAPEMVSMVRALAGKLHARLPACSGIELRDLIQAGNIGLLQAVKAFESEVGASLAGYAKFRVRGEMLDLVRRQLGRNACRVVRPSSGDAGDIAA